MRFKTGSDPAQLRYGTGRFSHPAEWETTLKYLRNEGVDLRFQPDRMGYGPSARAGQPGNLNLDPNASISALRHETKHFEDDKARNFPGLAYWLSVYERFWGGEFWAYVVELRFAGEMKDAALAREIVAEMRKRRAELRELYGIENDADKRKSR